MACPLHHSISKPGVTLLTILPTNGLPYNLTTSKFKLEAFDLELRDILCCATVNAPLYMACPRTREGASNSHHVVWSFHLQAEHNELASKMCCISIYGDAVLVHAAMPEHAWAANREESSFKSNTSLEDPVVCNPCGDEMCSSMPTNIMSTEYSDGNMVDEDNLVSILSLPYEVTEKIFSNLVDHHESVIAVAGVCTSWRRAVRGDTSLLKRLFFPVLAAKDIPGGDEVSLASKPHQYAVKYPCIMSEQISCCHMPCKTYAEARGLLPHGLGWLSRCAASAGNVSAFSFLAAALERRAASRLAMTAEVSQKLRLEALEWWQEAADVGMCQRSQLAIGLRLYAGLGENFRMQESDLVGVRWGQLRPDTHARKMLRAAAQGGPGRDDAIRQMALLRLGVMALDGQGLRDGIPDLEEAHRYLKQAGKMGSVEAKALLDDMERYQYFANGMP